MVDPGHGDGRKNSLGVVSANTGILPMVVVNVYRSLRIQSEPSRPVLRIFMSIRRCDGRRTYNANPYKVSSLGASLGKVGSESVDVGTGTELGVA